MIAGARKYSLNRSSQVLPISEWASRIAAFAEAPARAKSASLPSPMSTKFASSPAAGVGGAHPTETSRIGNGAGIRTSSRVAPSLQLSGMVYFSARTSSTPAWRKAATAQATARLIAGEPVIRPPTSSVSRRRFSSSGDGPSAFATIFGMASSHSDADVAAEHPPLAAAACMRASGSGWARGICATAGREARRQRSKDRNLGEGIGITL